MKQLNPEVTKLKNTWRIIEPWLLLAKIYLPDGSVKRFVDNPEDVYFGEDDYTEAGCMAHWQMNDNGSNTTVVDSGPNGYDGTLTGGNNTEDMSCTGKVGYALKFD